MIDEDKNKVEWKPLQVMINDFNLNNYIGDELIKAFKNNFEGKKINAISLSILIDDEKNDADKPSKGAEIISFNHRTLEEKDKNLIVIDMNYADSFNKIEKIIKKL